MTSPGNSADFNISVVIPALNGEDHLPKVLRGVEAQTLLPREIVIVDSSRTTGTARLVESWKGPVPITFTRVDFAFPGRARNLGSGLAKSDWIAFLDCRTVPTRDWLAKAVSTAASSDAAFVPGLCISDADTSFKRALRAATYGNEAWTTVPGSLVRKSAFQQSGGFTANVRAGEDLEWMDTMRSLQTRTGTVDSPTICYTGFPDSLPAALHKWYVYAIANAAIEVRNNYKKLYLALFVFAALVLAYKWNAIFASWDMRSVFYVPNIMKISIGAVVVSYVVYRGIVRPVQVKIAPSYLLPWRWLGVSFIGLCIDLAKAPGLLWGAMLLLKRRLHAARLPSRP